MAKVTRFFIRAGENVGNILSGSANILHEVGGIIGLFTGQPEQQANHNQLNTGGGSGGEIDTRKKTPWAAIIIGLVVVGAIVGVVVYMNKKKKAK